MFLYSAIYKHPKILKNIVSKSTELGMTQSDMKAIYRESSI
jgi:hypothetical protein